MTKPVRLVMPVVVAVVLGPLVAGLCVCLLAAGNSIFGQAGSLPLADLFDLFGFYILAAYLEGGVIALLAGLLVSIWMTRRSPNAIVVIAAAVIATTGYMGIGVLGPAEITNARSDFLFTLVLAVIAATVCWLLTRRYAQTMA